MLYGMTSSRPRTATVSPPVAQRTNSKSPASQKPPWNTFCKRDVTPPLRRMPNAHTPTKAAVSTSPTASRVWRPVQKFTAPFDQRGTSNSRTLIDNHTPASLSGQTNLPPLVHQLEMVVAQLSHAASGESSKLAHMQAQLDAYQSLVNEQDRMIDELRSLNAKLQKERDALAAFRPTDGLHPPDDLDCLATAHATPKTKSFVQSLVDQLKEEKRLRLQVEEQSSRMIGEQQVTIHRLEDRLGRSQPGNVSPTTTSRFSRQHSSASGEARTDEPASTLPLARGTSHAMGQQLRHVHSMLGSLQSPRIFTGPYANSNGREEGLVPPKDSDDTRHGVADVPLQLSAISTPDGGIDMDAASAILQQIKLRHGL